MKTEALEGCRWVLLELGFTSKKSPGCKGFFFLELHLEEPSVCPDTEDTEHWAEALLQACPSLLIVLEKAGGDTVAESATGEVCQPRSHGDSLASAVGGQSLRRPRRCCASARQQSRAACGLFLQPPPG